MERAAESVTSRSYDVLRNADEMAIAGNRRVIKLHGSLPAQFPLIVTEEDYRTYPARFAPFVNTVQQAMMETTLLLLGFSGRDPNFLQWSGWVRDQLGSSAPKIYLAGWLGLHPHERRVLESRNVVPIDLALHPSARAWEATGINHRFATEWILYSLELGRPYPRHEWPSPPSQPDEPPPDHLQPIKQLDSEAPEKEPSLEFDDGEAPGVADVLRIWRHNRRLYPGWLAVPATRQADISGRTAEWEDSILREVEDYPLRERVRAIHEIVWRHRILLEILNPAVAAAAQEILDQIADIEAVDDPRREEIDREAVRCICAELLAHARFALDLEVFENVASASSVIALHDGELGHIVCHERCLWALFAMDIDSLRQMLEEWRTDNGDPFWNVRKAALMLEAGVDAGVADLIRASIVEIRNRVSGEREIAAISREAWASLFMAHLENKVLERHRGSRGTMLATYARFHCDVWNEMSVYGRALEPAPTELEKPVFDLGVERPKMVTLPGSADRVWGTNARRMVATIQAVRLGEVMGLPPTVGFWSVTGSLLSRAAEEMFETRYDLALRLMLRVVRYDKDKLIEVLLSRTRVARLPEDSIQSLMETCERMLSQSLPPFVSVPKLGGAARIERARVAVEVQSRVSVRLRGPEAVAAFQKAIGLYADRSFGGHTWMAEPVRNLLARTWEALRPAERTELAFEVLGSPIQGFDGFAAEGDRRYPDPGLVLDQTDMGPPSRTAANEREWQRVVSFLVRSLGVEGEPRERGALRLAHVAIWAD